MGSDVQEDQANDRKEASDVVNTLQNLDFLKTVASSVTLREVDECQTDKSNGIVDERDPSSPSPCWMRASSGEELAVHNVWAEWEHESSENGETVATVSYGNDFSEALRSGISH